jgi:hypothetical protein
MNISDLVVIVPFTNPCNWRSRLANMRETETALLAAGAQVATVELTHGDRPFQLPDRDGINRLRYRGSDILWHKENLFNVAAKAIRAPLMAIVDGDILFNSPTWIADTVHALDLHAVVQITDHLDFLGPEREVLLTGPSYMAMYQQKRAQVRSLDPIQYDVHIPITPPTGYPGGAWAWRREALEAVGGLPDICIIGAGDQHAAWGLTGTPDTLLRPENATPGYIAAIQAWQTRCATVIRRDVGLVPGAGQHLWHGNKADRKYPDRWRLLTINRYDPETDIIRNHDGIICLAGNKPDLRDDIRAYFFQRSEDVMEVIDAAAEFGEGPDGGGWYAPHRFPIWLPHHLRDLWQEFVEWRRNRRR